MAVNACKDVLKSAWWRRTCGFDACAQTTVPEPEDNGLLAAVQVLPRKYREAIYLHYYEGYGVQEIAEMLGRPAATVSTHLRRGRERLKTILGGQGYETV